MQHIQTATAVGLGYYRRRDELVYTLCATHPDCKGCGARLIMAEGRARVALCVTHPDCNGSGARLVVAEGRARVYALCNTSRLQRQWSSASSGGGTSSCIRSVQHIHIATAVQLSSRGGRARVYALCNTSRLQRQWSSVSSGGGTHSCIRSVQYIHTAKAVELG